jgi:hypothetical protein
MCYITLHWVIVTIYLLCPSTRFEMIHAMPHRGHYVKNSMFNSLTLIIVYTCRMSNAVHIQAGTIYERAKRLPWCHRLLKNYFPRNNCFTLKQFCQRVIINEIYPSYNLLYKDLDQFIYFKIEENDPGRHCFSQLLNGLIDPVSSKQLNRARSDYLTEDICGIFEHIMSKIFSVNVIGNEMLLKLTEYYRSYLMFNTDL